MPTTYTHYRFGQEVMAGLPENLQEIIFTNTDLFNIGLHGPDILFYYKPYFWKNSVIACGRRLHREAGAQFMKHAENVLKIHGDTAHLAYVYGFLCHFALDRACHPYVNAFKEEAGISHGEVEMEFDRRLLVHDGYDPLHASRTTHIHVKYHMAEVIADFYPQITVPQIMKALCQFCIFDRCLAAPPKPLRAAAKLVLHVSGNDEKYGMFMSERPNPVCMESNAQLLKLYRQAKREAVQLVTEYADCLQGKKRWSALYQYDFGGRLQV